ncbi:hypothetical protein B0H14DRAFT_2637052 [Mycena olivaceomarginata]|nr:hypothetical protein B0H14DRAFT_2637052 [Mycena olivaceomarginata]
MTYYDAAQGSLGRYTSASQIFARLSGASSFGPRPEYIYDGCGLGRSTPERIPLFHLRTMNGFFVKNHVQYELNMQRGRNIPPKIYKGSLENREDSHGQDLLQVSVVGNVDKNQTSGVEEHHLQAALAISTVRIPIPGSIQPVENYTELYPSNRWMDTKTYLQSAQTISEAYSAALLDHDYTYIMAEADKTWLDNTNYRCRVEEQIAQETPLAETDEIFIRVSISEDEFELVMGLFEILTGPKVRIMILVSPAGSPGFLVFKPFFLAPLRPDSFASHVVPTWIRPPSILSSIAFTVHPHWLQRRSLRGGRKIIPSLNREENDYINTAYAQNLKVGKAKVWCLQVDSSAQHLANEREKLRKASPRRSQRLKSQHVQHIQGRAGKETATQNQSSIKRKVSGARTMRSHTHSHSVTATEQTVSPGPDYLAPRISHDPLFNRRREGTSMGEICIIPATRVSGSQHIPSPSKKFSGDGMADSLKGDEAHPLLIHIPAQTIDTKNSRQLHDHGPARDENNSLTINFFTGRFAFPPTLLECVQGPLRADGTNSTSVVIDPETSPIDMAQTRTSICFGLPGSNGTGRAYASGTFPISSSERLIQHELQIGHHRRSAPSEKRDSPAETPQIAAPARASHLNFEMTTYAPWIL